MESMDRYLRAEKIMQMLGIGRSTVYALFKRKGFPSARIGRRIVVSESALREWLANGGTARKA